jgi:hypothetical protein
MSAFTADGDFVPRLPAHPLSADAPTDPSFGRLIAMTGHPLDDREWYTHAGSIVGGRLLWNALVAAFVGMFATKFVSNQNWSSIAIATHAGVRWALR